MDPFFTDDVLRQVWEWTAPRSWGPYPGAEQAHAVLLADARMEWARVRICRARGRRRRSLLALFALLVRLLARPVGVSLPAGALSVAPLCPQVGHGVLAPVRGSPWPAVACLPGVPPA
jgi:hypothetical protein